MRDIHRSAHPGESAVAMQYCIAGTGAARASLFSSYAEEVAASAETERCVGDCAPKQDCRFLLSRLAEMVFAWTDWFSRLTPLLRVLSSLVVLIETLLILTADRRLRGVFRAVAHSVA